MTVARPLNLFETLWPKSDTPASAQSDNLWTCSAKSWMAATSFSKRSAVVRRTPAHLCQIAETLKQKGVDLVVLDQNIDTSDATGRLLFNMLGAIGQFETEIRAERQMDGIKKAKDRGVQFGKRPALSEDQIVELRKKRTAGMLIKDLMAHYSLSKATIYRYLGANEP